MIDSFEKGDVVMFRVDLDIDAGHCFDHEECETCPLRRSQPRWEECDAKPAKKGDLFTVIEVRYDKNAYYEDKTNLDIALKLLHGGTIHTHYCETKDKTVELVCKR